MNNYRLFNGATVMKTKGIILTVFLLAFFVGSTPVLAGIYGYRHYRHPNYQRYHHNNHHYYRGGNIIFGTMLGFTLGTLLTLPPPPPPVYIYREYPPPAVYEGGYGAVSCLQTREYTATITIEGKEVEAYGTKCLRPDGSWSYGPAQPVPNN